MRKYILLILLSINIFALDTKSTLALYEHLFVSLSSKKMPLIYVEDKKYKDIFMSSRKIKVVSNISRADIILITTQKTLNRCTSKVQKNKIWFSTEYHFLTQSEYIVGASYWKKGRAQLLFVETRLKSLNINLSSEYRKFMIETL